MKSGMSFSAGWVIASMLVGSVGGGFFIYGKKQARLPQLFTGILLVLDSGVVSNVLWMYIGAGVVLALLWGALRTGL
jgi:hypothetical protein